MESTVSALQRNIEERANAANAQYNSTGDQRLAGATYIGNELPWLWQPKPKKCRKQLNGHLLSQTTIVNRLESTFPPHLCKKIKFVPDSRQPFENGRILNLAVGLLWEILSWMFVCPRLRPFSYKQKGPFLQLSARVKFSDCLFDWRKLERTCKIVLHAVGKFSFCIQHMHSNPSLTERESNFEKNCSCENGF